MAESRTPPLPLPPRTWRASVTGLLASGQRRLRVSMYFAFAAVAVAVAVQGALTLRHEHLRAADVEILDLAGLQRTRTQQIGREAALLVAEPAARQQHTKALSDVVTLSVQDALQTEALLAQQIARSSDTEHAVAPAVDAWQNARERMWYRSQTLLRQIDAAPDDDLSLAAAALRAETDTAMLAAQHLSTALREAADARTYTLASEVTWGVAGLMALFAPPPPLEERIAALGKS